MKKSLKILSFLLAAMILLSFAACGAKKDKEKEPEAVETLVLGPTAIEHEEKFGGVYIKITIDDFNKMGFAFGDSINLEFSNGFTLNDIPYYNGFYVDMGAPLLVGYPGYPYIRAGYNNGEDLFVKAGLKLSAGEEEEIEEEIPDDKKMFLSLGLQPTDTAKITLNQKAKYLDEQNAMDIHYSDEQGDRPDAVFANFREVNVGNLKDDTLYRSASPCDNQHKRAAVSDRLISEVGVNCIINLSDNAEELASHIEKEDFNSPYFLSVYEAGNVIPLSMSMAYKSETFSNKLADGLRRAAQIDGPYLVHCVEGKDRTGFVCMVIEALAGATYDEIIADYMVTYDNYYGINKTSEPTKYNIIKEKNIDVMLKYITGDAGVDIKTADYAHYAKVYLASIGLTDAEITALENRFVAK